MVITLFFLVVALVVGGGVLSNVGDFLCLIMSFQQGVIYKGQKMKSTVTEKF